MEDTKKYEAWPPSPEAYMILLVMMMMISPEGRRRCRLDFFFFFKDFIYLFERERQPAREGTQAGEVGKEEAGS